MMRQRIVEAFESVAGKGQELNMYGWEKFLQELRQRGLVLPQDIEAIYKHTPCFPLSVDTFIQTLCMCYGEIGSTNLSQWDARQIGGNRHGCDFKSKKLSRIDSDNQYAYIEAGGAN